MNVRHWTERIRRIGTRSPIEDDLSVFDETVRSIHVAGSGLTSASDDELAALGRSLRQRALSGETLDNLLPLTFAAVREAAYRALGLRPFDVQLMAGIAIHRGKLAEMNTGEGKTLAAVAPAILHAFSGRAVHILTFNDYLARRDAEWMGPVYRFLGLTVGGIQEGMSVDSRRSAYAADVTYATAKEAGFDFLRSNLARDARALVQRPFHFAIVDEADSILIDEARVPLVIAGERPSSSVDPRRIAEMVRNLRPEEDWVVSEYGRNVELTDAGLDRVEHELRCGPLHAADNYRLLTEINQSLHAHVLLRRDVDYIVTGGRIELVDEFTGRVVDDRRWPDGLQAALEAKEGLQIRPGGRVLGSITLQHFLARYPRLAGMTATARSAAEELFDFYGLTIVPIPPNRPSIREDLPDVVLTSREARSRALVGRIRRLHKAGRPVLVGTRSVAESEELAGLLKKNQIPCSVLNAKNDEEEAGIIAEAGRPRAVTISTNMAGRGTDIRLGGRSEDEREEVVARGGLFVIGTARHESRRIDDQLRGRAGRQGDPGTTQFFVSLDDDLLVRYGIDDLIPRALRPRNPDEPMNHPVLYRELDRLQRIAAGKCFEIRRTLWRYSVLVERQRRTLHGWRRDVLDGTMAPGIWAREEPDAYRWSLENLGQAKTELAERAALLHFIDESWAEHLDYVAHLREGIHLVGIAGLDPLHEFHRQIAEHFEGIRDRIEDLVSAVLVEIQSSGGAVTLDALGVRAPSATWTYLVNDQVLSELQQMLFGRGNVAFTAGAVLMTWPLLAAWAVWRRLGLRNAGVGHD